MKIRTGFVSNSSSTSFCIFGVYVEEAVGEEGLLEKMEALFKDTEMLVTYGCQAYDYTVYVGVPPEQMKEDETTREFKERVSKLLKSKGINEQPSWITDGGYNG